MELRARAISASTDLQNKLENALHPNYWQTLNPTMTVCGSEPVETIESFDPDPSRVEQPLRTFSAFGYFQIPPTVDAVAVEKMRRCFETTESAGWPPVFVFVYDEFWRVYRGPLLVKFLKGALGEEYGQLPYLWGHHVPANSRGWRPHVDGPTEVKKLTVWLALSDATLENGCMYVVPRNSETEKMSDQFFSENALEWGEARKLLQNVKALPAAAGSYLGWGPYVIHWGATSGPMAGDRISISAEFSSRPPSEPLADQLSLIDADPTAPLPLFSKRLQFIAQAIKDYERFDPKIFHCLALAKQILSRMREERTS